MKKTKTIVTALCTMMLTSCGFFSTPESANIEAQGDEIQGLGTDQMAVEGNTYTLEAKKRSKDSDTWMLQISVKLSKNTDAPLSVPAEAPVLVLTDEAGEPIGGAELKLGENSLDVKSMESLRTLLTSSTKGQLVCSFFMSTTDQKQVKEIMKSAKRFVIKGFTGGSTSARATVSGGALQLRGVVDKYPVVMMLNIDGTQVSGSYYYVKDDGSRKSGDLSLSGTNNVGSLNLNEVAPDGTPSGHFVGALDNGYFSGTFTNNQGKKMSFALSENGDVVDFGSDGDVTDDAFDEEGDASIDAFLDDYEQYVKNYVAFMKKYDSKDPTAVAEYAKMVQELQRMSEKVERFNGKMSTKQIERMNKINMRITEIARR